MPNYFSSPKCETSALRGSRSWIFKPLLVPVETSFSYWLSVRYIFDLVSEETLWKNFSQEHLVNSKVKTRLQTELHLL